jgi:cobalt/nickel transport system ATP-binding protein
VACLVKCIEVRDLFYSYEDGTQALQGINLTIEKNTRVALLGPNGAGKSTLLLHFNALNLPQRGSVLVEGTPVCPKTEKLIRAKVGMVFQDPDDQIFALTVREDVSFGPQNMGLPPAEVQARVDLALRAVRIEDLAGKAPYHLSYGQKKRVAIAGVLAMSPEIIILDEPFAYLDPRGKRALLQILADLSQEGKTIIIATHDVDLAAEWADKIVVIQDGRVLAAGEKDILLDPEIITRADLDYPVVTKIFQQLPRQEGRKLPLTLNKAIATLKEMLGGK